MIKNSVLSLLITSLMILPSVASAKKGDPARCAARVKQAGCYLSNNDAQRIANNVIDCKQVNSSNGDKLEVFQLEDAGKLVVVNTNNRGGQYCPTTKYTIDSRGIKTIKIISGKVFMLSNAGRVYLMLSDEEVFEVLNSKKRSYSNVTDIKGDDGGTSIIIVGPTFKVELTMLELIDKALKGQLKKISFRTSSTNKSLFRDE